MSLTNNGRNIGLDAIGAVALRMQLFGDEEGGVGTPVAIPDHQAAAQLETIAWSAADAGSMAMSTSEVVFEVPGGWTVTAISFRSEDGNTEYGRDTLAEGDQETYSNDGTYTVTSASMSIT